MLNEENLKVGEPVPHDVHQRMLAEHREAHNMVIRGDAPDFDTALVELRGE